MTMQLSAQRYDNTWMFGDDPWEDPLDSFNGNVIVTYYDESIDIQAPLPDTIDFDFQEFNVTMSDASGDLIFYTNGIELRNKEHKMLYGSKDYNYHPFHENYTNRGLFTALTGISLPYPGVPDAYILFHCKVNFEIISSEWYYYLVGMNYSVIDMSLDHGRGAMVIKDRDYITDTLNLAAMSAVRHANGRDWWVIATDKKSTGLLHLGFVDERGPGERKVLDFRGVMPEYVGGGPARFTPDGRYFIRYACNNIYGPVFLDIFSFDRCTGHMELIHHYEFNPVKLPTVNFGLEISPNSRFVYCNTADRVMQFDLWTEDVLGSMQIVAEYDTIQNWDGRTTAFILPWLAPDGKIYMTASHGYPHTHVMHYPNRYGSACQFEQRAIVMPRGNINSIPHHPNYRLGPIDDSSCDTLGIDNIPLSRWRADTEFRDVQFISLADYEPEEWYWTFGDGQMSRDTSPYHNYADTGWYEVCLIVSNEYGGDTLCRHIHIIDALSAVQAVEMQPEFLIYPNPADDYVGMYSSRSLGQTDVWIRHMSGEVMLHSQIDVIAHRRSEVSLHQLQPGFYLMELRKEGLLICTKKLIVH